MSINVYCFEIKEDIKNKKSLLEEELDILTKEYEIYLSMLIEKIGKLGEQNEDEFTLTEPWKIIDKPEMAELVNRIEEINSELQHLNN